MKIRTGISIVFTMFFFVLTAMQAGAATKWTMATPYSDGEFHTKNIRQFAKDVETQTGGEFQIAIHSGGSLIKNKEIVRAVQSKQIQIGENLISNQGSKDPVFEIDGIPFLVSSYDDARKLWQVSKGTITERLKKQRLRLLYAVPWPFQGFFINKEISSLADLKGLKQRAYNPMTAKLADLMGTVPTTIQATEIPHAFATGIIDMMNTAATTGVNTKSWEFVKYYYDASAWASKNMVIVNEAEFQKLPEKFQTALLQAAAKAEEKGWADSQGLNESAKKTLTEKGMEIMQLSPTLRDELKSIGTTMVEDWINKTGDEGKAILKAYHAK